jgi:hypothetical protein
VILRDRISGRRVLSGTATVRTYARGRVCRAGDCGTVLSAYNPSSFCTLHERGLPQPRRVRRHAAELACENCGASFEAARETQRYCSDRCRMAAFARRTRSVGANGREER